MSAAVALVWTWTALDGLSLLGADGRWEAVGASGVTFTIAHYPKTRRRAEGWSLAYSTRVGHVFFTGPGPSFESRKFLAELHDRDLLAAKADASTVSPS